MGVYTERILPHLMDRAMRDKELDPIRARVAANLTGEVLEIGFGSGLNTALYPATVSRVLAVEPALLSRRLADRRATAQTAEGERRSRIPVEYIGLDGQRLPLPEASVDQVLSTWTLCSIPDVARALSEIRRVLRPGGSLHFAEHGLSPDPKVARWQTRLTPIQRRVAGGCRLNLPIADLITASGLQLTGLTNFYLHASKTAGYIYEGAATRAAP
ncbi:class I SAM-dependent methyltransferase [Nakamurella lactea]|uniref:class I SAM-dependent methyltransferase n=1 Tax=Nakamurella lactea TaxID=459515 RepID=UPI0003F6E341|nr:class I SAM-dependent methyltransferase [Nakamurella lactea]